MESVWLPPDMRRVMVEIEREVAFSGGVPPSVRELAAKLGARTSTSQVHRLLAGLERRGLIRRLPRRNRAIEVLQPVSKFEVFRFCGEAKSFTRFDVSTARVAIADRLKK